MDAPALRAVLRAHTLVMGLAGLALYLLPREAAALWPWTLPPLAARFMGSWFLGGAACSLVFLRARDGRGVFVLVLLALGDALIASAGLLGIREVGPTPAMLGFLAFFTVAAVLLTVTALPVAGASARADGTPRTRGLRAFFVIHLLVVLPVGTAMLFFPGWAQPLWAWKMAPINVRLIGSFFFGAAFISAWAARQRAIESLRPTLVLYAMFSTAATIAALLHFDLFDAARRVTWLFFALYVFVAVGSGVLLWRTAGAVNGIRTAW
jgi:hypothetical protein